MFLTPSKIPLMKYFSWKRKCCLVFALLTLGNLLELKVDAYMQLRRGKIGRMCLCRRNFRAVFHGSLRNIPDAPPNKGMKLFPL